MRIAEARAAAAARLSSTSGTPDLDARVLMGHVTGLDDAGLIADAARVLSADEGALFDALVRRRAESEPVAYIMGRAWFWTLELSVDRNVLIPRPETEILVENALSAVGRPDARVLDLGVGSGAILAALLSERPGWSGIGVDRSAGAVAVAGRNLATAGAAGRACLVVGSWADALTGAFDLVVSNPPYVADSEAGSLPPDVGGFEPREALFAADRGLADIRAVFAAAARLTTRDGAALCEIGCDQGAEAVAIARAAFPSAAITLIDDLAGRARLVKVEKNS